MGEGVELELGEQLRGQLEIDHTGVEALELLDEDLVEDGGGITATEAAGFLGREVLPAGLDSVVDEGVLDSGLLGAERHWLIMHGWDQTDAGPALDPRA